MSFKAHLKWGGTTFDVLNLTFAFSRSVDAKGKPASGVYGGEISLTVEGGEKDVLLEAMLNTTHKATDGSIEFLKGDEKSNLKTLSFTKGYITSYSESFSVGSPVMISVTISAHTFKQGNAEHKNDWPGTEGNQA